MKSTHFLKSLGTLAVLLVGGLAARPAQAQSTTLVINEIYGGGGNSGAPFKNDFVEVRNISGATVSLTGFSVQYASATGTTFAVAQLSGSLAPGGTLVVQGGGGATGSTNPTPDFTFTSNLSATAGKVALASNAIAVTGAADPDVIDFVGYGGTASEFETARAPAGSNTLSINRAAMTGADTNNNSADFTTAAPSPTSSGFTAGAPPETASSVVTTTQDVVNNMDNLTSFREAIAFANANPGTAGTPRVIGFNIPGPVPAGGFFTLSFTTPPPPIDGASISVDGDTQTTFTGNTNTGGPEIYLDGSGVTNANAALFIRSNGFLVRGLAINNFGADGTTTFNAGINVTSQTATGTTPVTSGTVTGCYIGTDPLGNDTGRGNIDGVRIEALASGVTVTNNLIAYNRRDGVRVAVAATGTATSTGNSIRQNSIFLNDGLGIDLGGDGVTANDADDADAGPNNLQNFPVISAATVSGTTTTVTFSLDAAPGTSSTVEFFSNLGSDGTGSEGRTFRGSTTVTGDAVNQSFTLSGTSAAGEFITATATDSGGSTSEFSAATAATAAANAPFVRSIVRATGSANPTTASSVDFTVTFSEAVTGVDTTDFVVTKTFGNATGAVVAGVAGSGTTYTVTVNGFTGSGTIRLDLIDDDSIKNGTGVPLGGTTAGNGNFTTGESFTVGTSAASGALISEFRVHGKTGATDDFVEIYNTQGTPLDISGWSIRTQGSTGLQNSIVPDGKIIPARGHFLFTGATYSLTGYGTGDAGINSTTPNSGDALDNSGIGLFNAAGAPVDAAGFTTSDATLREGSGITGFPTGDGEYAFLRAFAGTVPSDTNQNATDFILVLADGTPGAAGASDTLIVPASTGPLAPQLGAPSPQGLTSQVNVNAGVTTVLFDPKTGSANISPNRVRVGMGNSGTLLIRRTLINKSGRPLSRIRFTVTRISSLGSTNPVANQADVRLVSSDNEPAVATSQGNKVVFGTTLEAGAGQPAQPLGGALGSSVIYKLNTALADGDSANYSFLLQIKRSGNFFVSLNIEALPPQ